MDARWVWGGVGMLLGAVLGAVVARTAQPKVLPSVSVPTGASYDATKAVSVVPGSPITVPVGTSLTVDLGGDVAHGIITTSNAALLAPSQPATTNGFVAVAAGSATITMPAGGGTIPVTIVATA